MRPPFTLTNQILSLVGDIERSLGRVDALGGDKPQPKLRKSNRVRTLQGSLAIEGNTLETEQITALLDGKTVLAPKNDIIEILNANAAYELLPTLNSTKPKDLLSAHGVMMKGLISEVGRWRSSNVGIMKLGTVSHLAPPPDRVPFLMDDLFEFLDGNDHPLIQGGVFHYEFEFIHPFSDGNGRMGRFWHSLLLYEFHPVFEFIPVESIIKSHQQTYYDVLEACDKVADSTQFVEFSLQVIVEALTEYLETVQPAVITPLDRLEKAKEQFQRKWFSRKDYCNFHKTISTATASRDLKTGADQSILQRNGQQATTKYQFRS